jgi:hypothetical protein
MNRKPYENESAPLEQRLTSTCVGRAKSLNASVLFVACFALCGLLSLYIIWGLSFPAGVDIAQHAFLMHIFSSFHDQKLGYAFFFHLQFFTPYILTYVIAYPLVKIGGGIFAVKVLHTVVALGLPWQMARWYRAVGAEIWFSLLGFPLAFGFAYLWGFVSFDLSLPFGFAYLVAFQHYKTALNVRSGVKAGALAVLLFFVHAATFMTTMLAAGIGCLLSRHASVIAKRCIHLIPAALVAVIWARVGDRHPPAPGEWADFERITRYFRGDFTFFPSPQYEWLGAGLFALFLAVSGTRPARSLSRWLPAVFATALYAKMPDMISGTWLTASRYLQLSHLFAPAVLATPISLPRKYALRGTCAAVAIGLMLWLTSRMVGFDQEYRGYTEIADSLPEGADVRGFLVETDRTSEAMGPMQLGMVFAWLTVKNHGMLENDFGVYKPLPVLRNDIPWAFDYPYLIARGKSEAWVRSLVAGHRRDYALRLHLGDWWLFERPVEEVRWGNIRVVRSTQSSGHFAKDHSVNGDKPLRISSQSFATGLGTNTTAVTQIRFLTHARTLRGLVGIDETGAGSAGKAVFRIRDIYGHVLFDSGPVRAAQAPIPFRVPIASLTDVALESTPFPSPSNNVVPTDWVELQAE